MLPFHGFQHGLLKQVPQVGVAYGSERLQTLGLSKHEAPADWQNHHRTQNRKKQEWISDSDLDGPVQTQVGRSERSCPVTQVDASSGEEVLVSSNRGRRVVPRTDTANPRVFSAGLLPEHEFPTSGEGPAYLWGSGGWER